MIDPKIFGNGPESMGESILYLAVAAILGMVWITIKALGWLSWFAFLGLMVLPISIAYVGLTGVAVYSQYRE